MKKVLALLLTLAPAAFADTVITLAEVATAGSEYICFADLGAISGDHATLIRKQFLAPAPARGGQKTFTRPELRERLRTLGLDRDVVFAGSEKVCVTVAARPPAPAANSANKPNPATTNLPAKALPVVGAAAKPTPAIAVIPAQRAERPGAVDAKTEKALKKSLDKFIDNEFSGIEARAKIDVRRVTMTRKDYETLEITGVRQGRIPGRLVVDLTTYDGQGNLSDYGTAEMFVEVELSTPVLARSMNAGDIIGDGDIAMQFEKYAGTRPERLTLASLRGRECRRALRAGAPLSAADFGTPEIVKKSDEVIVRAGGDGFVIEERTVAVSGGKVGDYITVQSAGDGKRTYKVRLTGRGTAELVRSGN
ncbi:MAG: flagellar basal body P-ring formation chaperone FlgA [Planctomycetota bacterium]|jgi:flagella basal body P-ring formation protein FlgA|nr:flagellar basal body P-ring formation chaperone FlgA [Planctomycetota bacterium]